MATIQKNLGPVTAYKYAVLGGYTGTEEEYKTLMASYATVAEEAAESAAAAAESASDAAGAASTATTKATNASASANDAAASASSASTKAGEASSSAASAAGSASIASTKAGEAASSATAAAGSASTASTKASEAAASATDAATAKTAAQAAQTAAETAQGKAEDAQDAAEDAAETVSESVTQIATNTADISQLKSALNNVYIKDSYSVTQYGTIYHAFDFVAGHTYLLTNGTSSTANAYTFSEASSSGAQVEVIKENWSAGFPLKFTPTQNASAIKTFTNASGTITIVDLSVGIPKIEDDVDNLQDDVTDLQGNFGQIGTANTYGPTSNLFDFTESVYAGNAGYTPSNQYDSWEFTASQNLTIYMSNIGSTSTGIYMQLCVYPSGNFNDPDYVRYRSSESNLPSSASPLSVTAGTKLIISTNKDNSTWRYVITTYTKSLSENIMLNDAQIMQVSNQVSNMYYATYTDGVLHVEGNGINCDFSDLDFNSSHGVFELQNLTYNNAVIFDTGNDYLGPVRVHGESIKGAKHGEETSDSVRVIADGVTLSSGDAVSARQITIYVESTIDTDEFKRYTVWTLNSRGLLLDTILVTLKALNIDYVFGAGIISCQDNVNIAWLNKEKLSSDVLTGLNESTVIVTTGGTLLSRRVSVNSAYGDQRVAFTTYTGRKKLYYYTCYGSDISVPSGAVFASCAELEFM